MNDASQNRCYDLAHKFKLERDHLLAAAALEKKLFTECTWAKDYAESKLEQLRKKELFLECIQLDDVTAAADEYLRDVFDEDVEAFNVMLQSSLSVVEQANNSNETCRVQVTDGGEDVEMVEVECASSDITTSVTDEGGTNDNEDEDVDKDEEEEDSTNKKTSNTTVVIAKPKAKGARDRAPKIYISTKVDVSSKTMKKPPKLEFFRMFMADKCHKVHSKDKVITIVDVSLEPYILSHGYLYCECCNIKVDWGNRSKHLVAKKHIKNKSAVKSIAQDMQVAKPMLQQRIKEDNLVGQTYSSEKLESTMMWLKIACAGNWSTKSVEENRVSYQLYTAAILLQLHRTNEYFMFKGIAWNSIENGYSWSTRNERRGSCSP